MARSSGKCSDHLKLLASVSVLVLAQTAASTPSVADPYYVVSGSVYPAPPADAPIYDFSDRQMSVGQNAAGSLSVKDGATLTGGFLLIGAKGAGTMTVAGQGTTVSTSSMLYVGRHSDGTLMVSDGGYVQADSTSGFIGLTIGSDQGTHGQATVTGPGSSIGSNGIIVVGSAGTGALTIADGGQVSGDQLYLGNTGSGSGTVTITGQGSAWNGEDGIWVGQAGAGTLNLSNGGAINDSALEIADHQGTTGIVNIGGGVGQAAQAGGIINVDRIEFNRHGGGSNGVLNFNTTDTVSVHARIIGIGTINQIAGTTVLTGNNSLFAGAVAISGGTLQLGDGGTSGNLAVDVSTGTDASHHGTLAFNRSDIVTFNTVISGTGSVLQMGSGTTVLSGENSYSGGTVISAGTLSVAADANLGLASGGITLDGGTLQVTGTAYTQTSRDLIIGSHGGGFDIVDAGNRFTVSQDLTGQGGIWKLGNGTLVLTGSNSYSGGTRITAGTVSVAADDKLGLASGGLTLDGGTLQVTGTLYQQTDRSMTLGENGGGFDIADLSNTFTVTQPMSGTGRLWKRGAGTLVLAGDNSFSGGLSVEAGTAKAGIIDHAFGSGILSVSAGANADLANFNTTTGGLSGAGSVALGSGSLTLAQSVDTVFSGTIAGSGGLAKNGSGALTLSGANNYLGATAVNGGTLRQGAAGALSAASSYTVAASGTLQLGGFNTTMAALDNQGDIRFGGSGGARLAITGNYSGGGSITLNTELAGDDSITDHLKVEGDTAGATRLTVINQGGSGAQTVNGIKLVDIGGTAAGTFTLANGYQTKDGQQAVVGGAFAYTLQQGGVKTPDDGDWYLISHMADPDCSDGNSCAPTPRYSAGAPLYEGYVQNMLMLNKLPSLQQRVGNRYFADTSGESLQDGGRGEGASVTSQGVWARVEGAHNRLEPATSTSRMKQDINTLQLQSGIDGQFYENENGRLIAGITGQYGHAKGDVSSLHGDGSISTDAWSLGATATWYGNDGFYLDGQGQVSWFDNDLDSWTANQNLAHGRTATGYAASLETGKRIALDGNWSLTPQVQLFWSSISANAFRDAWNARVSVDDGASLLGRLGLAAQYATAWKDDSGRTTTASVYGIANLYQELLGGSTVTLSGVDFDTNNDRSWGGIGMGTSYGWADNAYALYGEGSINTGLTHFGDSYVLKGNAGFRVKW